LRRNSSSERLIGVYEKVKLNATNHLNHHQRIFTL
jgi:hypothetical protein